VAGIGNGTGGNLCDRISAIMSELPKTARHQKSTQYQEQDEPHQEDRCQAEEVTCIFESFHRFISSNSSAKQVPLMPGRENLKLLGRYMRTGTRRAVFYIT